MSYKFKLFSLFHFQSWNADFEFCLDVDILNSSLHYCVVKEFILILKIKRKIKCVSLFLFSTKFLLHIIKKM